MKQQWQLLLAISLSGLVSGCNLFSEQKQVQQDQTILEVGDQQVSVSEFEYVYEKNNSQDSAFYTKSSLRDYLDLYTEFKLKVEAAREAGLDTLPKLQREFSTYQDQLAEPYLQNDSVMSRLLKEAYQRHLQQVKARHISIRVPRGAPAADTAQAYRQLRKIRKKAKQGTGFESLAQEYQEQVNAGSLGYFSVFDQPYPVENTAYSLSPGSVSKPLRTDFGYHLIKVTDKRPYSGKMRAKHIMIKPEQKGGSDNQQSAQNQIDSLYQRIQEGADFSRIARRHSEDRRSSRKGGKLPLFDRTNPNFPSKFKRKAFALKENGAITEPFKTQYGYHLLKRVKMKAPGSFAAMKPELKKKLKKDKRYERVEASVTDRIKRQSGYKRMLPEFGPLPQQLDSTFKTGGWTIRDPEPLRTPLFRIGDTTYQLLAFARYLEEQSGQKLGQFKYRSYALEALYEDFEQERIKAYERRHLAAKYPEYRHLLKEYKEGVLLFEIMDRKVWSKAVEDSTGLRAYYRNHQDQYELPLSKAVTYYRFPSQKGQQRAYTKLEAGEAHKVVEQSLRNQLSGKDFVRRQDTFQKGQQAFMAKTEDETGLYQFEHKGQYYVVEVRDIMEGGSAPFEAVRGQVVADYQEKLEEEWLTSLRERFAVKVYDDVLESLVREP